jgi:hypothetical protein
MDVQELQAKLNDLRSSYRETLARGFYIADNPIRAKLHEEILSCERSVASLLGEEFALPMDWPIRIGSDEPFVLCHGCSAFVIYTAHRTDSRAPEESSPFAVLEFQRCEALQYGTPNDEVFEGHRLFGKGIEIGRAHTVCNSHWLPELEKINSIHSQYTPSYWKELNHYLLFFKERTFECVAHGVRATRISGDALDVLRLLYNAESRCFFRKTHLDSIFDSEAPVSGDAANSPSSF